MAYSFIRAVTIDHTKCGASDSTFFPVLFTGTYTYLKTTGNGGNVTNANGYDIVFTSDSGGTTLIPFERVSWDATSGACEFWFKAGTLSHTVDTVVYLCYGNSSITTDQSNKTGVWDGNFWGVWHLRDNSGLNVNDSTSNNNNGIGGNGGYTLPATSAAEFGLGGMSCSSSGIRVGNNLNYTQVTVTAWVNPSTSGHTGAIFGADAGSHGLEVRQNGSNKLEILEQQIASIGSSTSSLAIGSWQHAAVSYNGTTAKFYLNGILDNTVTNSVGTFNKNMLLGLAGNGDNWAGSIDEIHVTSQATQGIRSADWILAEYNNQSSPSTFYSIGGAASGGHLLINPGMDGRTNFPQMKGGING